MKMRKAFLAAAAAATLVLGGNAHALTADWGAHSTTLAETATGGAATGQSFADYFLFELAGPSTVNSLASVLTLPFGSFDFSVANGLVELYSGSVGSGSLLGSYSFATGSGSFGSLGAGEYFYKVSGDAIGTSGGAYTMTSTVSAVPEPETLALMLAGLGVIGVAARRRRESH